MKMNQLLLTGALLAAAIATGCASDRTANNVSRLDNRVNYSNTNTTARRVATNARDAVTNARIAVADAQRSVVDNTSAHTRRTAVSPSARNNGIVTNRTDAVLYNEAITREPLAIDGRVTTNSAARTIGNTPAQLPAPAVIPNSAVARTTPKTTATAVPTATATATARPSV